MFVVSVVHLFSILCCVVFLCVLFVFLVFLVCPTLSMSLDCSFVIVPSVLSNVYMGMIRPFFLATDYQRPLIFSYGSLRVATICILGASKVTFFIQKPVIYLPSWGQTACLILFCISAGDIFGCRVLGVVKLVPISILGLLLGLNFSIENVWFQWIHTLQVFSDILMRLFPRYMANILEISIWTSKKVIFWNISKH